MSRTREEQIEFLNEHYKFPCRIIFLLARINGEDRVLTQSYHNMKKDLSNIKFNEVQTIVLEADATTTLGVHEIKDVDGLIDTTDEYIKLWIKEVTK